jgi:acyl-CoA thioester hydrolase
MTQRKLVHTMRMPIRWADMDAMGHVNNAVYFRYLEQARVEWFIEVGCAPNPHGDGPIIISAHCTFLRQLRFPGEIEIRTYVGPPGRSSFEMYQEIRRLGQPEILAAEGGAKIVWVNLPSEKSAPLPERVRGLLASAN